MFYTAIFETDQSSSLPITAVGSSYYASMSIVIPDLKFDGEVILENCDLGDVP